VREAGGEKLVAGLEIELPDSLAVGRGNAVVVAGHCHPSNGRAREVWLEVDGERQAFDHWGLPRQDVYESSNGESAQAFKSGFVGIAALHPRREPASVELAVGARIEGRGSARSVLGSVPVEPALAAPARFEAPAWPGGGGPRVAICMATYNPPGELLGRQLDSIRGQSHDNWICLISDDGSEPDALRTLRDQISGDRRFALSEAPRRAGFYRNFERALSLAPPDAEFVTLCDQDDRWHPDKLERLLAGIRGGAELVYSDARVVTPGGDLVHDSYWTQRRNNHTNFASLLLANSVTGAASLFRRDLLDDALPFPQAIAHPFHDHWLAVVALARGRISYVDRPLYDYVQHERAVIGHSQANRKPRAIRTHLMERLRNPGDGSRTVYYYDWYQQVLYAEVLKLRCWGAMTRSKRRTLRRLRTADLHAGGLAWLLGRRARKLWGHDETLDRELFYGYALARRRAVSSLAAGRSRPLRWLPRDASIPSGPRPGPGS
jgi:glycosyltransferase involved in cell wall biosynthesis